MRPRGQWSYWSLGLRSSARGDWNTGGGSRSLEGTQKGDQGHGGRPDGQEASREGFRTPGGLWRADGGGEALNNRTCMKSNNSGFPLWTLFGFRLT